MDETWTGMCKKYQASHNNAVSMGNDCIVIKLSSSYDFNVSKLQYDSTATSVNYDMIADAK